MPRTKQMTENQREVLTLFDKGMTYGQIAEKLGKTADAVRQLAREAFLHTGRDPREMGRRSFNMTSHIAVQRSIMFSKKKV